MCSQGHVFNFLIILPMSQDSSLKTSDSDVKMKVTRTPRKSTLNFVRQFAYSYTALKETSFNHLVLN